MGCPWEAAVNTLLVCSLALQGSASNLRGTCGNWHCWWRDYCQHLSAGALCSPVPLERVLVSCGIVCTAESTLGVKAMSDVSTGVLMWLMSSARGSQHPAGTWETGVWLSTQQMPCENLSRSRKRTRSLVLGWGGERKLSPGWRKRNKSTSPFFVLDRSKGGIADRTNEGEIGGLLTIGYFMRSKRESRTSEL